MKKKLIAAAASLCLATGSTFGFTLDFQAFTGLGAGFQNSDGVFTNGLTVRVGSFNDGVDPVALAAGGATTDAYLAAFNVYVQGSTGAFGPPIPPNGNVGGFAGSSAGNLTGFEGDQVWIVASDVAGTQLGVFSNATWKALNDDQLSNLTLNAATADIAAVGSFDGNHLRLAALDVVPEPSTYALMLLGAGILGVYVRRRR
jgi:hypothetical protein